MCNREIPVKLLEKVCDQIEDKYGKLPFNCRGIVIGKDLIKATLIILNSQENKTLPQNARNSNAANTPDGLDKRIKIFMNSNIRTANIISDILKRCDIVDVILVENEVSGRMVKGTKLMSNWCW